MTFEQFAQDNPIDKIITHSDHKSVSLTAEDIQWLTMRTNVANLVVTKCPSDIILVPVDKNGRINFPSTSIYSVEYDVIDKQIITGYKYDFKNKKWDTTQENFKEK